MKRLDAIAKRVAPERVNDSHLEFDRATIDNRWQNDLLREAKDIIHGFSVCTTSGEEIALLGRAAAWLAKAEAEE